MNNRYDLQVNDDMTVGQLKDIMIDKYLGGQRRNAIFTHKDVTMEDEKNLSEYSIEEYSTIKLLIRLD